MSRLALCIVAVLLVMILFAQDSKQERTRLADSKGNEMPSQFYFGHRMGRKKRWPSPPATAAPSGGRGEQEQVAEVLDALREFPWTVIAVNEGKRHSGVNFTPRLGRESGEQDLANFLDADAASDLQRASPPFAPRLGRRLQVGPYGTTWGGPDPWE